MEIEIVSCFCSDFTSDFVILSEKGGFQSCFSANSAARRHCCETQTAARQPGFLAKRIQASTSASRPSTDLHLRSVWGWWALQRCIENQACLSRGAVRSPDICFQVMSPESESFGSEDVRFGNKINK